MNWRDPRSTNLRKTKQMSDQQKQTIYIYIYIYIFTGVGRSLAWLDPPSRPLHGSTNARSQRQETTITAKFGTVPFKEE